MSSFPSTRPLPTDMHRVHSHSKPRRLLCVPHRYVSTLLSQDACGNALWRMMPWSSGCSRDVVFAGKNFSVTFFNLTSVGCDVALSMNSRTFRFCRTIARSNSVTHSMNSKRFIHAFRLYAHFTGSVVASMFLKQRGFAALPMTSGLYKSVPVALQQSNAVTRSFDRLPPWHCCPLIDNVLSGKAR